MLTNDKITEIYCLADDFCKLFNDTLQTNVLPADTHCRQRNKPNRMNDAEIITIMILFHLIKLINEKGELLNFMFTPANVESSVETRVIFHRNSLTTCLSMGYN